MIEKLEMPPAPIDAESEAPPIIEDTSKEIAGDFESRGSYMVEFESYERMTEGLKMAADGCRHLARSRNGDLWDHLADVLDKVRKGIVNLAGYNRVNDAVPTKVIHGASHISRREAFHRLSTGLKQAYAGCEQMGVCQRLDFRWLWYSDQLLKLKDKSIELGKRTSVRSDFIWLPQ